MDNLTKNPGLILIAEEISLNLNYSQILKCSEVNEFWKKIQNRPHFWLQKCAQNPEFKNKSAWKKLIQLASPTDHTKEDNIYHKYTGLEKKLTSCLKWSVDIKPKVSYFTRKEITIYNCPILWFLQNCGEDSMCAEIIQKLVPLVEIINKNPHFVDMKHLSLKEYLLYSPYNMISRMTAIEIARRKGFMDIVKILEEAMK